MKKLFVLVPLLFSAILIKSKVPHDKGEILSVKCDRALRRDGDFRNFRSTLSKPKTACSKIGLQGLCISGSGQPTEREIVTLGRMFSKNYRLMLIDLRSERHGFINGEPIRLHVENRPAPHDVVVREEKMGIASFRRGAKILMTENVKDGNIRGKPLRQQVTVSTVKTEHDIATALNITYVRFPVMDKHFPDDHVVDRFVSFFEANRRDSWMHFHCVAGKGRTTIFMLLVDMLCNAHRVSFDGLVARQYLLGGANYANPEYAPRRVLLKQFYNYCCAKKKGMAKSWSQWKNKRARA